MKTKPKKPVDEPRGDSAIAVGPELSEIGGGADLKDRIEECETIREWSFLLNDYIQWGNNSKVSKHVAIFNMNAAHDCPNRWKKNCQVGGNECYAVKDEKIYEYVLDYFRRQEYLWDCMDSKTWVDAFLEIVSRKRVEVKAVKFSQSGDFRHDGDIIKVNYIADRLEEHGIRVFTYSASNYLDWSKASSSNLTVNQSNSIEEYGDRRYKAIEEGEGIPDGYVWCPYDKQEYAGVDVSERVKCGECTLCIDKDGPDVAVVK